MRPPVAPFTPRRCPISPPPRPLDPRTPAMQFTCNSSCRRGLPAFFRFSSIVRLAPGAPSHTFSFVPPSRRPLRSALKAGFHFFLLPPFLFLSLRVPGTIYPFLSRILPQTARCAISVDFHSPFFFFSDPVFSPHSCFPYAFFIHPLFDSPFCPLLSTSSFPTHLLSTLSPLPPILDRTPGLLLNFPYPFFFASLLYDSVLVRSVLFTLSL